MKTFDELHESGYRGAIMSLTEDELTVVWHSGNRPGTGSIDLWIATRSSMEEAFGNIRELTELNTVEGDTAPRISPDGLTIYFGSQYRDGSTTADLYKATRPSLAELFTNVERIEFPGHETRWEANPFITPDGSTLFFDDGSGIWVTTFEPDSEQYPVRNAFLSSDGLTLYGCRVYQDTQRIVEFNRDLQDLPFEEIREYDELDFANGPWVSLDGLRLYYHDINGTLYAERSNQTEVWTPIRAMTEIVGSAPTLTDDELLIFYHSSASGSVSGSDRTLWIASRASIHDPFSNQRPLDELNCPNRQYAPSVLADGLTIYFASNRDDVNNYSIYKATRQSRAELFSQIQKVHDGVGTITQTPFVTEDETRLFYVDRLEAIQQEGTFLTEWVPNSEECLPR